ncbi:hypothetical protein GMORB2_7540 [Geosmithia morbida]|uniref:Mitochondrial integral membrane protein n=1 Tax=Geosmithia morbida TaxID=1094350 RepID=A0A9P4YVP4_9HYPO|nr:uncharacterized protein GMORB2_7540 [Geosmithia morbida]KAF4122548.1 hypothetical protein GMORB2_7540 [Geosmithia morbida]
MPLFSKNTDEQEQQQQQQHPRDNDANRPTAVPDERTRLLPDSERAEGRTGALTPDDPAVTPYNLWTIRLLRFVTVAFTLVTLVWWTLVLISGFVTPPGFQTRGGPFLSFGFACLTLANMVFTLLFFEVPAKAVRILCLVMAGILLVDVIVILAVERTRSDEGWVGTVSVVWALLMSLWSVLVDSTVKWGKAEEEERLTGRPETRRTLVEWVGVMASTVADTLMTVAVVLMTLTIFLRAFDSRVAAPGKMYPVDGGKYRIHVYCRGGEDNGSSSTAGVAAADLPTVLFEGGERSVESGLWKLADEAVDNGSIMRYCFADRPGVGWSDAAPSPLSASLASDVLSEALSRAGEHGPWVLASAGVGSIYQRVFSSRHGSDVRGLVLIDPLHEDYLESEVGSPGRGFFLWLRGVLSPLGLDRLPGAIFKGRSSKDRIYGRAEAQGPRFIFSKLQENLVASSFTKRDVQASRAIQPRDTNLAVISSGQRIKKDEAWARRQRDLTKLTDKLKHWDIVDRAPHEVWNTAEGRETVERRLRQLVHGSNAKH